MEKEGLPVKSTKSLEAVLVARRTHQRSCNATEGLSLLSVKRPGIS